jgi:photosystem II stability/assembly factor-like uncharacterized protein
MEWPPLRRLQAQMVSPFTSVLRWSLTFALPILALGIGAAAAAEEILPEPAVQSPLAEKSLLLDATAIDGNLVVVGGRGHILTSTDNGASWQQAVVPTRGSLTGVYFHDRDLGWAVGHDAVILRTGDGGTTWKLVNWAPEEENPLLGVWFWDADNGFAFGAYGSFYRTTDGGETWSLETISEWDFHLHHIARAADGRLYMAAEAGVIYRSDDGGQTWAELQSPYEGSFFGVLPLEGDTVLVFGLQGHLFRSQDAGESWTPVETGTTAMLTDGIRLREGEIIISGLGGTLLISTDGGASFELLPQPDRRGISAIVEVIDGQLLMVGEFGVKVIGKGSLRR